MRLIIPYEHLYVAMSLAGIELMAETLIYSAFCRASIPVLLTHLLTLLFAVAVRFFISVSE